MKNLILAILLFTISVLQGQTTSLDWVKSFGSGTGGFDNANAIAIDNNGNTIVVGTFENVVDFDPSLNINNVVSKGATDGFIAKYDSLGVLLWLKTIGGVSDENINSVGIDNNNNIFITGNFSVTTDFDPSAASAALTSVGNKDIFFAKYDQNGNYIWAKQVGSAGSDNGTSLVLDSNGNIFITGRNATSADFDPSLSSSVIVSNIGSFLAKYDNNGSYLFAKNMSGGSGQKLFIDNTGSVYVTGWYDGSFVYFTGSASSVISGGISDIYVAKYNNFGSNIWYKTFTGSGSDIGHAVTADINGNVYVMGLYQATVDFDPSAAIANLAVQNAGDQDIFLLKLDNLGNYVWANTIGGPGNKCGYSMLSDSNNNIYICGYSRTGVDFDPSAATATISTNSFAAFLANYDSNGNYNWLVGLDGGGSNSIAFNFGIDIKRRNNGNIVFTGSIHDTTDFDPSPAIHSLISRTANSTFFAEYTSMGAYVNAGSTNDPSSPNEGITDIVSNAMGYIYSVGYFNSIIDFDPGMGAMTLMADSAIDCFLVKQDTSGNVIWAANIGIGSSVKAFAITTDVIGNVYVAGRYINNSTNSIYIAKYDANGIMVWENIIGGSNLDYARTISIDNSGKIVITGTFMGNVDFDPSGASAYILSSGSGVNDNLFIAKYDLNGNYVWAKSLDTKCNNFDCKLDANDNMYLFGNYTGSAKLDPLTSNISFTSTVGTYNGFLAKYDPVGQFLWSKSTGNASVSLSSLTVDNYNNLFLLQTYSGTLAFVSASSVTTTLSSINGKICLSKFDTNGNNIWAKAVGGQNSNYAYGICLDNYNNVFITGSYNLTANFDQSSSGSSITSAGLSDIYLAAYDSNSNFLWIKSIGGTSSDDAYSVFSDGNNNIYIAGRYNLTVDFDPSSSSSNQISWGGDDMFICKYRSCTTCQDVWPGDANSDGMTDNLDVLELGLHFTQTGSPRASTSNTWQSYFANNWTGTITNGKNLNHSDCNGDGMIDDNDTLAIYNNYGLSHSFKTAQTTTVNPQLIIIPDQVSVVKGTWGAASIYLGDATNSINNLNGVAFTLDFDNSLIETNNIYIEYQNSFLDAGQNLDFRKLDFPSGKIFTATTHTVNNNVSGYGKIATLHYQIKSSLTTDQVLNLGLSQANQSNASGIITSLTTGTGTLMALGASVGLQEVNGNSISISPNPTNGSLTINSKTELQKIEVVSITGQVLVSENPGSVSHTMHLENFSNGIYFVNVYQNDRIINREKIVINK